MILVVKASYITTMAVVEWIVAGPKIPMTAVDRPTRLIWMTHPVYRRHVRFMMILDPTVSTRVWINETTLDIKITLPDETASIGKLTVSLKIAMTVITTNSVHKTILMHPRTPVMIVITIRGVTRVLPTATFAATTAPTDTLIGIGDMWTIGPAYWKVCTPMSQSLTAPKNPRILLIGSPVWTPTFDCIAWMMTSALSTPRWGLADRPRSFGRTTVIRLTNKDNISLHGRIWLNGWRTSMFLDSMSLHCFSVG